MNPTWYAVELLSAPLGVHGSSQGQVVSGGLNPNPAFDTYESETVVYLPAPNPMEAMRQALVGSVLVDLSANGKPNTSYPYNPGTLGLSPGEHRPFVLFPQPPSSPPDPAVSHWQIALEDLAAFPDSDWDYNDHTWAATVTDLDYGETGNSSITGIVWKDDVNGSVPNVMEPQEPRMASVAVDLYRNGSFVRTVYTDPAGHYAFVNLGPSNYQVQVQGDILRQFVTKDVGYDSHDSDVSEEGWSNALQVDGAVGGISGVIDVWAGLKTKAPQLFLPDNTVLVTRPGDGVNNAAELKVAKWETAFSSKRVAENGKIYDVPALVDPDKNGSDFIDVDVDRFNVLVKDVQSWAPASNKPYITVSLATINSPNGNGYNDGATTIPLVRLTDPAWAGWYMSDSQILVSNKTDDDEKNDPVENGEWQGPENPKPKAGGFAEDNTDWVADQPNQPPRPVNVKNVGGRRYEFPVSDRTHIVALGGKVEVTFAGNPNPAKVPVKVKGVVKLHVNIMRNEAGNAGVAVTNAAHVDAELVTMREVYAQIGLDVQYSNLPIGQLADPADTVPKVSDPPAGVDLKDPQDNPSLEEYKHTIIDPTRKLKFISLTSEERALLTAPSLRTGEANGKRDIEVYFINRLSAGSGGIGYEAAMLRDGVLIGNEVGPVPNDRPLGDSVILAMKMRRNGSPVDRVYTVSAHEAGHLLDGRPNTLTRPSHFPYSGRATPAMRSNLMTDGLMMVIDGKGYVLDETGKTIMDGAIRKVVTFGSGIFDSRRLTRVQDEGGKIMSNGAEVVVKGMTNGHPELIHPGE